MRKVKIGLIGCGNIMDRHVAGVNSLDNAEITAVCDIVRENAERVANSLEGDIFVCTNYKDIIDHCEAVIIATPHDLHYEMGMFFAHAKKHIMMEKPLVNTEEEGVRLCDACDENGVILMCAYPVRYMPGVIKLKELLDSGEYGKAFQLSIWTEQLTGIDYIPYEAKGWAVTGRLGGGQLFSHGCHYIDIMLWLMGNPEYGTHIGTNLGTPWMLREGTSQVSIKFESGAIGYHGATWGARGTALGYEFQVHTEKGLLEYDHNAGEIRFYGTEEIHDPAKGVQVFGGDKYVVLWTRDGGKDTAWTEKQHECRHFADCVLNGKKPNTPGRESLQSLRVIWELYNAERNGIIADLSGLGLENA